VPRSGVWEHGGRETRKEGGNDVTLTTRWPRQSVEHRWQPQLCLPPAFCTVCAGMSVCAHVHECEAMQVHVLCRGMLSIVF
jgi:hypothetical protein